jgi:hypothetical protein
MRGSSGGDGSGEDGSGEDPLTMGEFELLYIPAQAPTSEDALIIIEVSAKKNATASNPFGICVDARTSPSGNVNRNVNPGALKADGCSEEFDWKNYSEFMGEIAGIAIAAPFAAPWIAPALTIPGVNTVVVGATVVVAGYLLIKWLSEPTPYQLIQQIEVDCDISCGVSSAALSMIAASAISTAGMLYVKVEPKKLINDTLDRLSRQRYIPHRGDPACCETVCRAALLSNPGCYGLCFEQCTFHTQTCWETGWDIIVPGGCGLVGRLAAVACSYAL